MSEVRFKIGDLVIALITAEPLSPPTNQGIFSVEESYLKFVTNEPPHVVLNHHYSPPPNLQDWHKEFDTGGVWQLYTDGDQLAVALSSPAFGPAPYQVAIFSKDFLSGEIYTSPDCFPLRNGQAKIPFPLRYPLAEVLMINLLGQDRGVLLHACAVKDNVHSYLFSGMSGAGKSTTARLWETQPGVILLSDDRVILRKTSDGYHIYGTPWHGDARAAAQISAPLDKIFVLRHASHNYTQALKPVDLAAHLLVRSFPTFWDPAGMAFTLKLLDELSRAIPGFELGFLPDERVIDFVRQTAVDA